MRNWGRSIFAVLILFCLGTSCRVGQGSERLDAKLPYNVVLLLADDQGAHLSALGTPGIATPNVDRLAQEGILFAQVFAAVPSCSPSRSSINTGMFPHANGHWRNTITPELSDNDAAFGREARRVDKVGVHEFIPTLPEILQEAGYFTAITQKFHMSPPWKFPYSARDPVHNNPTEFASVTERFLTEAGEQPFFLQMNISPPHRPFRTHMDAFPEYLPDTSDIHVPDYLADVPEMRMDLQEYYGSVQLADACAGAVIETLRKRGLLENTLIIYTGDQGAPYHRAKASAYAAGLHVPLVVSGPGVQVKGIQSEALISLVDIMPTILELLKLPIPETVQGHSFLQAMGHGPAAFYQPYVFGEHNSHGPDRREHYPSRMVYDGHYYYLVNLLPEKNYLLPADLREERPWGNHSYAATVAAEKTHPQAYALLRELESGRPAKELYDLANDPGQLVNLAGLPAYTKKQDDLATALAAWRKRTGDRVDDPVHIPTRLESKNH